MTMLGLQENTVRMCGVTFRSLLPEQTQDQSRHLLSRLLRFLAVLSGDPLLFLLRSDDSV